MSEFKVGDIVRVTKVDDKFPDLDLNLYPKNSFHGIWIVTNPGGISLKRPNKNEVIYSIGWWNVELLVSVDWPNKPIKPITITPPSSETISTLTNLESK